jgi:hypothetical protein
VKNAFFQGDIFAVSKLAEAPESECQSLICCDPGFTIKDERVIGPLLIYILAMIGIRLLVELPRVCPNVDIVMLA